MRAKTPGILEFAELEEYAAVPVRALSSGMVARLGFSIATDTNPDILILDEVLSVGDESFRNRSRQRIESMWHDHVTVLLVSHDLQFIRESCTRAIWMDAGAVRYDGPAGATVDAYLRAVDSSALTLLAKARARLGQ
jgi:ABC-2 type transport system ATP-binding protein/lipopolysaccharide transport system ATP-binding protein